MPKASKLDSSKYNLFYVSAGYTIIMMEIEALLTALVIVMLLFYCIFGMALHYLLFLPHLSSKQGNDGTIHFWLQRLFACIYVTIHIAKDL